MPTGLVANPTAMSSVGKNARNKLYAIACKIMLQRGKTRPNMLRARLAKAAEAIMDARHYTRPMASGAFLRHVADIWRKMAGNFSRNSSILAVQQNRISGAKDNAAIFADAKPRAIIPARMHNVCDANHIERDDCRKSAPRRSVAHAHHSH